MLLIFRTAFLTSCMTSKKVNREVAKQYSNVPELKKKKTGESITYASGLITMGDQISTTETNTSNMLPLLVYW